MAKRPTRRKAHKIQPAVHTLTFELPLTGNNNLDQFTIDISQCASIMNRRFYRQGLNWAVGGFKLLSTHAGTATIMKLPNTWVMSNAWEKGFRAWQDMNNEAMVDTSIKPKFLDFKIFADSTHHSAGPAANLLPINFAPVTGATQVAGAGQWSPSEITFPTSGATGNATNFEIIGVGASYPGAAAGSGLDAVSLIEGYAASRALPNRLNPNTPADADDVGPTGTPENWLGALTNEGTDQDGDVLENLQADYIEPPYPFEGDGTAVDTQYPGGANQVPGLEVHDVEYVTSSTIGGKTHFKGGNFPCGLVRAQVQKTSAGAAFAYLQLDLVPGSHRGYLCESMTDM